MNNMAFDPVTSCQIDTETMGTMTDFIFLGSKITAYGDCNHRIKRHLFLGRKAMIILESRLKQTHHLFNKGLYSQSYVFPVAIYGYESWTIKTAEH